MKRTRTEEVLAAARVLGFNAVVFRDNIPLAAFATRQQAELWTLCESSHAASSDFNVMSRAPHGDTKRCPIRAGGRVVATEPNFVRDALQRSVAQTAPARKKRR